MSPDFIFGFIAASILWLAVFALGLAAIRRHRGPSRRDYGHITMPAPDPWQQEATPRHWSRITPPPSRHFRRHAS